MQQLLILAERLSRISDRFIDVIQNVTNSYIMNSFFPWVCIILYLNRRNLTKPVNIILIGHWFLRSTGDMLRFGSENFHKDYGLTWPFSVKAWYFGNALAHIFWLSGEVLGDWYPLLRTKAVTNNNPKKMKSVYITCILYNIVKLGSISSFFLNNPINLTAKVLENGKLYRSDIELFNLVWWSFVSLMQITSIFYDISVIYLLRKRLFNKMKEDQKYGNNNNNFIEKFKLISEYRIVFSLIASVIFLPIVITFVVMIVLEKMKIKNQAIYDESAVEQFRQVVLSINYNLMYIDQILLRRFVEDNQLYIKRTVSISHHKNLNSSILSSYNTRINSTTISSHVSNQEKNENSMTFKEESLKNNDSSQYISNNNNNNNNNNTNNSIININKTSPNNRYSCNSKTSQSPNYRYSYNARANPSSNYRFSISSLSKNSYSNSINKHSYSSSVSKISFIDSKQDDNMSANLIDKDSLYLINNLNPNMKIYHGKSNSFSTYQSFIQ
ncbi:hypothetical protein BCR32DRAFT_25068 [Anaeromyces robustus]|uniref:Uncharacterized protein n=1 Tax=Anaeromyces robustus TaxID=1754192 RepID=A0A1Y1X2X8_9FUNG|nr:hypothetical protein BCR32DRAFT_25068 [Anaeromyces robustus]|eukprot:ORX80157.1 hypothetical protein BCR32DRAFT_25068 [Anaeromyces robustus]